MTKPVADCGGCSCKYGSHGGGATRSFPREGARRNFAKTHHRATPKGLDQR